MDSRVTVRAARAEDAATMARMQVQSWRDTYRGLMRDEVLDDPTFVPRREEFWTAALTDERYAANRAAVAECDGEIVGVAMSGPPLEVPASAVQPEPTEPSASAVQTTAAVQLYILYVAVAHLGQGVGLALLDAVIRPSESACLWVADPNPRAQVFYAKHGFRAGGAHTVEDGVREIRMVRPARA